MTNSVVLVCMLRTIMSRKVLLWQRNAKNEDKQNTTVTVVKTYVQQLGCYLFCKLYFIYYREATRSYGDGIELMEEDCNTVHYALSCYYINFFYLFINY